MTKLKIKTAKEYVAMENQKTDSVTEEYREGVVKFINEQITPEIERHVAYPEQFTSKGHVSFQIPSHPSEKFVKEVRALLNPLGYLVEQSHDGGGMYATVEIYWGPRADDRKRQSLKSSDRRWRNGQ
jgi:hypothetical protein